MNNFFSLINQFLSSISQFIRFNLHQIRIKDRQYQYNSRITLIYCLFIFFLSIALVKIIYLTFINLNFSFSDWRGKNTQRAQIVDNNNNILAFSQPRYNIYFNGKKKDISLSDKLNLIDSFNLTEEQVTALIKQEKIVLIKRFAKKNYLQKALKINRNNLLLIDKVNYRQYPYKELLAQTIGFVGYDGQGLTGLEFKYNQELNFNPFQVENKKVILNIQKNFQREIELILKKSVVQNEAKSGSIIVNEIHTGKIIGLANYPTFDLNHFSKQNKLLFRNLSISTIIDPGSIFKAIFSAYLIEKHNVNVKKKNYFCKGFYELKNGEIIKCHAHHGKVSLEDIIKYSCNAGIIEATEIISNQEMHAFLKSLLVGKKSGIDLPGDVKSNIPPLKEWGLRTRATLPLGQGISISPIQLSAIFSAFIGKGTIYQPQIVKEIQFIQNNYQEKKIIAQPKILSQVLHPETTEKLVKLLILGTIKGSTGSNSRQTGLNEVFGKTGTSQLVNLVSGGYYTDRYDSVFAGGYPSSAPQFSILVIINQPKKEYYGGKVAAPLYAQVVEKLIFYFHLTNERIIEKYNHQLIENNQYNQKTTELFGDSVPNFLNHSLRSSLIILNNYQKANTSSINFKINGSGYVYKQYPPPFSSQTNSMIKLYLK